MTKITCNQNNSTKVLSFKPILSMCNFFCDKSWKKLKLNYWLDNNAVKKKSKKQKCIQASTSACPTADTNSCGSGEKGSGSGGPRSSNWTYTKAYLLMETTGHHRKRSQSQDGRRKSVCDTAKVWCKQEQSCVSSHSSIMTVKSSLEEPPFLRTKDNFLGFMPCVRAIHRAEEKHMCFRQNLVSH